MALGSSSLFNYGQTVSNLNQNLQFQITSGGTVLCAVIPVGSYSLSSLLAAVSSALALADPTHTYTVTANRVASGGTQNRITIASSGSYLKIQFGSGSLASTSCAALLGFAAADLTGATSYTGTSSSGTTLVTARRGFSYLPPALYQQAMGAVNVTAAGYKEAIIFKNQQFGQVEYRYETLAAVLTNWSPLMIWMMDQAPFEWTPEIASPGTYYPVTLEKSAADGKGMAFQFAEQTGEGLPNFYKTGLLTFRVNQ